MKFDSENIFAISSGILLICILHLVMLFTIN